MKDTLQPGVSRTMDVEVTADLSPPHLAPIIVLSTPSMIRLMEEASLEAAQPHLDANETSVGTHVNVSHQAAAGEGETVRVEAEVIDVSRRRITFAVAVRAGTRVIGEGTHERAVIDTSRFG